MKKVFGVGLNKTGTSTLGECLRLLGYKHTSFRSDMLQAWVEGNVERIIDETRKYESFEDWPWPLLFKELYHSYGANARYILTVRCDSHTWLESLKRHSLTTHPDRPMRSSVYGFKYPHGYEQQHLAFYERHNAEVRFFFDAQDPEVFTELCWEKGDGWEELCRFLNRAIPNQPFPHIRPNMATPEMIKRANQQNIAKQLEYIKNLDKTS